MNYYQHHIGDYTRDTAHLTMLEEGAYRRLLDLYYASERPLPTDRKALYRIARATQASERKAVDTVLAEYFVEKSDGWHQGRCDKEIAKALDKSDKASASAGRRWHNERNANAYANALPTQCEGNAPSTPIASTPITNKSNPLSGKPDAEPPKKLNGAAFYPDAEDVLSYLNKSADKGYEFRNRSGGLTASADRIIARLKQGYTREELREVVHAKCAQWNHDDKMAEYLRPATLFGKEKFEQYLGELKGANG